eukprot:982930-Amphidinium_carterae.1
MGNVINDAEADESEPHLSPTQQETGRAGHHAHRHPTLVKMFVCLRLHNSGIAGSIREVAEQQGTTCAH